MEWQEIELGPAPSPWWEEVAEVRARIERRREREGVPGGRSRTVLTLERGALDQQNAEMYAAMAQRFRREPTALWERLARKPDRLAAWAVALGFLMVIAGLLGSH